LLLRVNRGDGREQEKCTGHRAPHTFPHTKPPDPFVSRVGSTDCGQARKGCKGGKKNSPGISSQAAKGLRMHLGRSATPPLGIVSFLLTPQEPRRRIPATFPCASGPHGSGRITARGKMARHSRGGKTCSICRVGPFNALIRSARRAATGCGPTIPEENSAAIAALRSTMFRHRSAHACGCVPARWEVTVHRAARRRDRGSRRERLSGPLVPVTPGRAVPANGKGFK
jgi:hypothetical protein